MVGEGPAHAVRVELDVVDLAYPLADRLECLGHVVVGVPRGALADALGDDQDRRRILPRLTDRAIRHLDAGGVQIGHDRADADLLAARDARVGVGDRHREALLAHHEDRHAVFAERVVDVVGRIAAHPRNALGLERAREAVRRFDFHGSLLDVVTGMVTVPCRTAPTRALSRISPEPAGDGTVQRTGGVMASVKLIEYAEASAEVRAVYDDIMATRKVDIGRASCRER